MTCAIEALRFLIEHRTAMLSVGMLTLLESVSWDFYYLIEEQGAWFLLASSRSARPVETAAQVELRSIIERLIDLEHRTGNQIQSWRGELVALPNAPQDPEERCLLPGLDSAWVAKMILRTVLCIRTKCSPDEAERIRSRFGFIGVGYAFTGSFVDNVPSLETLDNRALVRLLKAREPMLRGDGSDFCARLGAEPTVAPVPCLRTIHASRELVFFLDVSTRPASGDDFTRKASARMLWVHRACFLEVENDDWDPEADWQSDAADNQEGGRYSPAPDNWHSDETNYDQLAACNFAAGVPGRKTLGLRVRDEEVLLIEIKLAGLLEGPLVEGLFFSRVVSGQTLRELHEAGDVYGGRASISPGYSGSRCVRLFDWWPQNVKKRELSELSPVHEAWHSLPGLKYATLSAGVRVADDGKLFVEDVHYCFPSTSGMGLGIFDGNVEVDIPIAEQVPSP